jgi:hypothetical protein
MTDEQRIEEASELDADQDDDVEAHKRRLADEPSADDESDDVEAHKRR